MDLEEIYRGLTLEEREFAERLVRGEGDRDVLTKYVYDYVPVPMDEFIEGRRYLNLKGKIFPRIFELAVKLDQENKREGYMLAGKGGGKGTLCSVMLTRAAYRLNALRSPQAYYGLLPGTSIVCINVSVSERQAYGSVFKEWSSIVGRAPIFENRVDVQSRQMLFGKNVIGMTGHSQNTNFLGLAIYAACMDEVEFMKETKTSRRYYGEDLYDSLKGSQETRFPGAYKLYAISSMRDDQAFLFSTVKSVITDPSSVESQFKTVKDELGPGEFTDTLIGYYRQAKTVIRETEAELAVMAPTWALSEKVNFSRLKRAFIKRPLKALRDFGNVVIRSREKYIKDLEAFKMCINPNRRHPIAADGTFEPWFRGQPFFKYFAHCDLSYRRDSTGFCLGHMDKGLGKVVIDLILQIPIPEGQEMNFQALRSLMLDIKTVRRFNLVKVSFDQFMSAEMRQQLQRRFVQTDYYSADRNTEGYDTMVELANTHRLDLYDYPPFFKELPGLILINGNKVDHEDNNSKDCADSLSTVCFHCLSNQDDIPRRIPSNPMPLGLVGPSVGSPGGSSQSQGEPSSRRDQDEDGSFTGNPKMPLGIVG